MIVDVRTALQFDEAHIPGAVCITMLSQGFGTKLSWVADPSQEIVLVGRDDDDARRAALLATAVGVRTLSGFLSGGMTSWRAERREVSSITRWTVEELAARMGQKMPLTFRSSTCASRASGATVTSRARCTCPYHDIHDLPEGIDAERPVAAICASGQRSATAASLLAAYGAGQVIHVVDGGVQSLERLGRPLVSGD